VRQPSVGSTSRARQRPESVLRPAGRHWSGVAALFIDSGTNAPVPESKSSMEVPVALLSQALVELRTARGNREAEREAAIRYFKSGISEGHQIGSLLEWLCFWPNNRESVFWQARLDSKFVEMLKKLSLRDLS